MILIKLRLWNQESDKQLRHHNNLSVNKLISVRMIALLLKGMPMETFIITFFSSITWIAFIGSSKESKRIILWKFLQDQSGDAADPGQVGGNASLLNEKLIV